jgi:hypothetical protein
VIEELASRSPHFRSLSSYRIPQTSQNLQIKILINYMTFRTEFIMHNALMIEKKQAAFLSLAKSLKQHLVVFLVTLGGVRLIPLGTSANVGLLYQPRMIEDDDYGAVGGMRVGRGNRSTRRKPAPVPLCPPQIPHDLAWDRTRAAAVGNRRLTA